MAFQRPTLGQLVDRIQTDFVSRLQLVGALLRRSIVYVLVRVIAGAAHLLHGHLQYLGKQIFPDQSDGDFLIRQAGLFGLTLDPATFAKATATVNGTDTTVIPATSSMTSSAGFEYTVDADATISSGSATISVTAVLAGADPTLTSGLTLTFGSPIAGANASATVTASTRDGADEETIDGLRTRLEARMGEPPEGGNVGDYIEWAKEVTGVTRVWVEPLGLGPGTVLVYFMRDLDSGSPFPDTGEVTAVQNYIGGTPPNYTDALAPAHASVTVASPTNVPLNITCSITPSTVATQAAVEASLSDMLYRTSFPACTTLLSQIQDAIGEADGVTDYTITLVAGTTPANVVHTAGQLPTLGTVTFT